MRRTCLFEHHRRAGARMVDFHGWEMPLSYSRISSEHVRVRESAGLFDLCHMGRLELDGPDAREWVQAILTNDVDGIDTGRARYSLICTADGGILDDVIVYRLPDRIFLVVNASNREAVIRWFEENRAGRTASLRDRSGELGMIAVQGPAALDVVQKVIVPEVGGKGEPLESLRYYQITAATFDGEDVLVATTGYTGEKGYELYLPAAAAPALWERLLEAGGDRIVPVGLGARDTLRLEAGMPLHGNELGLDVNPYEAGLGFAVKLDKTIPFIGREALARIRETGPRRKLIGLRVESRKVARTGMAVLQEGKPIGKVTSGTPSPTLGYPIALALVDSAIRDPAGIEVEIRGNRFPARPEALPFYSNTRRKSASAL